MATQEERLIALDRLHTRVTQCFTLLVWRNRARPVLKSVSNFGDENLALLQNAAIEVSLLSVRTLNEFFRPRTSQTRPDDIVAEDYPGYRTPGAFLTDKESRELNKRLFPITCQSQNLTEVSWNIAEMTVRAATRAADFLQHLVRDDQLSEPERKKAAGSLVGTLRLIEQTRAAAAEERSQGL
jgi:hypothetical protein